MRLRFVVCVLPALLAGCATTATLNRIQIADDRINALDASKLTAKFHRLDGGGEISFASQIFKDCAEKYLTSIAKADSASSWDEIEQLAFDGEYDANLCLKEYGARAEIKYILADGEKLTPTGIVRAYKYAISDKVFAEQQRSAEIKQFLIYFAIARSASQSYAPVHVSPYSKSDGTPVRGHWRTRPDGYCYNNISGC